MNAPYACLPDDSRGRLYTENLSTFRSPWQRDRDRIIHSSAFRRLKHKTQVFVEQEGEDYRGDYFRTRLTHTIEVAQVARTIAGALGLNTDLAETVALAHDLGHPPFGHTGEDALAVLMEPYGGFDHNAQALRIVTRLERHYADFDGLNLTWEALEGIAKHNGPVLDGDAGAGAPLPYALAEVNTLWDLELHSNASAEAQVAAVADDVAYNHHDLHDGLRAGLFTEDDLAELPVIGPAFADVDRLYPGLDHMRRRHEALRRVFGVMVEDVIAVAQNRLTGLQPQSAQEIRDMDGPIIRFSKPLYQNLKAIKSFLFARMYRAPSVVVERASVTEILNQMFPLFLNEPALLPGGWGRAAMGAGDETLRARIVLDYVAGMTDRYAISEHQRLIGAQPQSSV
ncbi:deoxyguanosinetriphosphate triphosphohydrolase [Paracoccus sp. (in: a-proteobacteria)]|uniref:deoxyguanosinetriphosphate triphosphohydrolase n=1 Tax=Paracoccus sp. TaxID=267 RepID=UPI003A8BD25C